MTNILAKVRLNKKIFPSTEYLLDTYCVNNTETFKFCQYFCQKKLQFRHYGGLQSLEEADLGSNGLESWADKLKAQR